MAVKGTTTGIVLVGEHEARRGTAAALSMSTPPATEIEPAPSPVASKPAEPTQSERRWESLVDFRETDPLPDDVLGHSPLDGRTGARAAKRVVVARDGRGAAAVRADRRVGGRGIQSEDKASRPKSAKQHLQERPTKRTGT